MAKAKTKTELKDLYGKITKADTKCEYFSDSIDFKGIIDQFKDVVNQDGPDGIILVRDTAYMVEHFQISLYLQKKRKKEEWVDGLKQALNTRSPQREGNTMALFEECKGDWEGLLLNNWFAGFSNLLDHHLSQYPKYEKRTHEEYPNKPCKFILTVEDNSNSIISDDGLCILDIQDFVEKILSYNEIDGVIVFNTSTRGNSVIAKDRSQLEIDRNSRKLRSLSSCNIHALIKDVNINEFTPEQRADLLERICHILVKADENMSLKECVDVIKHESSVKMSYKKLYCFGGIGALLLVVYFIGKFLHKQ